jgi:pimeloyl-ACP methyl ester carboxylesterase
MTALESSDEGRCPLLMKRIGASFATRAPLRFRKPRASTSLRSRIHFRHLQPMSMQQGERSKRKPSVILVGHSYGGAVITQAGVHPKVAALVYVAAFAPPKGESVNGLGKGQPAPPWSGSITADSGGYLSLTPEGMAKFFAQDLPAKETAIVAATQGPTFSGAFDDKVTETAYAKKPSWYVIAKQDRMIPPDSEMAMAKAANAKITAVQSSHVAMLSKPKEVAEVILAAAASVKE